MKTIIILCTVLMGTVFSAHVSAAAPDSAAKQACGENTACINLYKRAKYYQSELAKCKAASVAGCPGCPGCPACLACPACPASSACPVCSAAPSSEDPCQYTLFQQADIVAKIKSMDTFPISSETTAALKAACKASSGNLEKFVEGFLCAIHAKTSFKNDSVIIKAIDNLEYIDTEDKDLCEEISALP